jgi:Lrp/AsnC family transcriptional regulator, regulator for asnA, asnC and gidA
MDCYFLIARPNHFISPLNNAIDIILQAADLNSDDGNRRLIDDVNLKIIDILNKDSSTPFVNIAKQIGVSDATIHIRVRRMISAGIINRFTISVDNGLLGYDHLAFMGINIEPGSADSIISDLSTIDEVLEIHEMHGRFDLLLKIRAKDLEQMRDIVENKVRKLPHILETELMTVLKTEKEEQMISLDNDIAFRDKISMR